MNTLEAMERRLAALYHVDARGRILSVAAHTEAERAAGAAPRFHLVRTSLGNMWRFRSDLAASVVKRLATLAGKEAALVLRNPREAPEAPEREEFMRRALEELAPVESSWAGPGYAFPETLEGRPHSHEVREWTQADVPLLHAELADAAFTPGSQAVVVDEQIVSLCICARGGPGGFTEAGIRTAAPFTRQGHAAAAVRAWAVSVRELGGEPFYSTSWDNAASLGLAAHLGLIAVGEDRHWY
ncbi:MAG: hypothetical protein VX246_10730 [Myxococcota bacterium]|nr:hypothetical protein [Myxococcota bacterium]